ncbi:MAG: hypothetical protein IJ370_04215 [Oscillospiraceae bacterium]|nr:hypothetical protein [Oscillospiraceae bacterium]
MKKGSVNANYDEEYIQKNRTFPVSKTILLIAILVIQIVIVVAAFRYNPKPQDIIRQYDVTVDTKEDGSLDIYYHFVWEAVDVSEDLTWIEIGMANSNYSVYNESVSDTIRNYTQQSYDGEIYLVLYLDRAYVGGEVLEFSFKVNQKDMLCMDKDGYFYEFVPGWFNATPVENYTFRWEDDINIQSVADAQLQDGYYTWQGSFECGGYTLMDVRYKQDSFAASNTVPYHAFDDSGAYNSLNEDKYILIMLAFFGVLLLVIVQVWTVDSVVSYHRGRGFLTGHGYHVHAYGRSNPYYIRARNRYNSSHSGRFGGRSGGCACACACACAGGGRAGCSQKDTYSKTK